MDDFKRGLYMQALEKMKRQELVGICDHLTGALNDLSPDKTEKPRYPIDEIFPEFIALKEERVKWYYIPINGQEDLIFPERMKRAYWWDFHDFNKMTTPYGKESPRISMLNFILNNR